MDAQPRILLVEDDIEWQEIYRRCLKHNKYKIVSTRKLSKALDLLEKESFDVILTDLKMFGGNEEFSGFSVLSKAKQINSNVQVIVITAYGSVDHALRAMGNGAYDYITKDRELRRKLPLTVQNALDIQSLKRELLGSKPKDDTNLETDRIIGNSVSMQEVFEQIAHAANNDTNVLIYGEEGTGKRLIAQTIHQQSVRKTAPFWTVDCGSLSESSIERELVGYEANVLYSGCPQLPGKFEQAHGGVIFLDGIDDLNKYSQMYLQSLLTEKKVTRVGGNEHITINARIIASSKKNLHHLLSNGQFRRGLFDILNETSFSVPPLRARKDGDDILTLAAMFLQRHKPKGSQILFSGDSIERLTVYDYPGNVRELEGIVKYALTLCRGKVIKPEHLRPEVRNYHPVKSTPSEQVEANKADSKPDILTSAKSELSTIRRNLENYFSEEELRNLCFDLEIDYESLEARGKAGKVRELVNYMNRRGHLQKLVSLCIKLRPNVNWK